MESEEKKKLRRGKGGRFQRGVEMKGRQQEHGRMGELRVDWCEGEL